MPFIAISEEKINLIKQAALEDKQCKSLKEYGLQGWPDKKPDIPILIQKPYYNIKHELHVIDDF